MHSPHPPRPGGGLPRRVPGSGKQVGDSSTAPPAAAQDTTAGDGRGPAAPLSGPRPGGAPERDAPLPRLTQFSSLGSRMHPGDSFGAPPPAAGSSADESAEDRAEARPQGRARDVLRLRGDKARREGSRGALGVVGVVGLLSAVAVALTLGLDSQDESRQRNGGSVVVDTDDYGPDDVAGLGGAAAPSASASGDRRTGDGKDAERSPEPSASATPGGSASPKGSATPGAQPSAAASDKTPAQQPAPEPVPGVGVFSHASQRCIDIVGGRAVAGAGLMIWDCSGSASQHWTFPSDGTMRSLGLCVELAGGSTADGADLRMATCDGGPAQQITLNFRHDVASTLAGKCVDVRDNLTANGSRLQLWSCNGQDNQKWSTS